MNKQRYLLVVSGPSGAGKDTVVSRMMQKHPEIEISVSATTRAPRAGETDGENYYFLTNEQFEAKELPYAREYDFSVENRDVDACADEIYRILKQRQQD